MILFKIIYKIEFIFQFHHPLIFLSIIFGHHYLDCYFLVFYPYLDLFYFSISSIITLFRLIFIPDLIQSLITLFHLIYIKFGLHSFYFIFFCFYRFLDLFCFLISSLIVLFNIIFIPNLIIIILIAIYFIF